MGIRDKLFGRKRERTVTPRSVAGRRSSTRAPSGSRFHAVVILAGRQSCEAARERSGIPFLSSEAPTLPLEGCDNLVACRCRYQHRPDRRGAARRDVDHGLPERFYEPQDRRLARRGRRASDARSQ